MDLVDYDEKIFEQISADFTSRTQKWGFSSCQAIPVSALFGENLFNRSLHMPWFKGLTLLQTLEQLEFIRAFNNKFIFPVQNVLRQNDGPRAYLGTIACGAVKKSDDIYNVQSRQRSRVKEILTNNRSATSAQTHQAVAITLRDDIDATRGDVFVTDLNDVEYESSFAATLVWLSSEKGVGHKNYDIKMGHQWGTASLSKLISKLDFSDLTEKPIQNVDLNDIAQVEIKTSRPMVFTSYDQARNLGSFILVDRVDHSTLAAGIISSAIQNIESKPRLDHPKVIWLTGLSGAGKTTIAHALAKKLSSFGVRTFILDGDQVRKGLSKDLGFSEADRAENIRRSAEVCKIMIDAGLVVIAAFISPFEGDRQVARQIIGSDHFREIYLSAPLDICTQRDPKGLYKKAKSGEIKNFTGISSPYEKPKNPDLEINTALIEINKAVEKILEKFFTT